jgi:hypothetical protein
VRGERTTIYTDGGGRRWRVRELLQGDTPDPDREVPAITHATLVFESRGERRFAQRVPLDWREKRALLGSLFDRAKRIGALR